MKCQAVAWKLSSLVGVENEKVVVEEVMPTVVVVPPAANRKRGRHPRLKLVLKWGSRPVRPWRCWVLSFEWLRLCSLTFVQKMRVSWRMIEELIELQSRATIVGRTMGDELCRAQTVVVPKLETELEASASSLKTTLEAADTYREEM